VSLASFFDVSTDDGVLAPVTGALVAPPADVVAGALADVVAGAAVVLDELPELLPHAAATRPTTHSAASDPTFLMWSSPF